MAMTLDDFIAELVALREKHGGGTLVTVNANGYDGGDHECAGAMHCPPYRYPSGRVAPEHVAVASGKDWDGDNPHWHQAADIAPG